jgi:hypothetical protein
LHLYIELLNVALLKNLHCNFFMLYVNNDGPVVPPVSVANAPLPTPVTPPLDDIDTDSENTISEESQDNEGSGGAAVEEAVSDLAGASISEAMQPGADM